MRMHLTVLQSILVASTIGSVLSLVGGVGLLSMKRLSPLVTTALAAFAGGALLATAFLDLLPEAAEEGGEGVYAWVLVGILGFYLLERSLHWFHHHSKHHGHDHAQDGGQHLEERNRSHAVSLIIIGDTVHNFIDGVVIAGTFLADPRLGVVTTIAVALHEIPQEIGDFGLLLHWGLSRKRVLWYNVLSALATLVGAYLAYTATSIAKVLPVFLALTAGFFIYIATSDILPEIHEVERKRRSILPTLSLFLGVLLIAVTLYLVARSGVRV